MSEQQIELSSGTIRYRDVGHGPTVVFVHGLLVDGSLWRKVVPPLQDQFRCIVPDWPLGSHTIQMKPTADLTPTGVAALIGEFLKALDLTDVTLVANDTGGALTQILIAGGCDRVGRAVLTPCDAFENFLPPPFRPMQYLARIPGGLNLGVQPLRLRILRRLPIAFGWLIKRGVPKEVGDAWLHPYLSDRGIRRDTQRFVRAINKRDTLSAVERLGSFTRPVLIVWASEDRFFPIEHARRLAEILPDARLVEVSDSYSFISEDRPVALVEAITAFVSPPSVPDQRPNQRAAV